MSFKIYVDTEHLLKRIDIRGGKYTKLYQKHVLNSIGVKLVCIDNKFTLPTKIFTGNNSIDDFIKWVFEQQKQINEMITNHFNKKIKMRIEMKIIIKALKIVRFAMKNWMIKKVRDHCYITSSYRGAAHNQFNLKLKIPQIYLLFFTPQKVMMDI